MDVTARQLFIDEVAKAVMKYAHQYNIYVCSPIIAQACKESAFGESELAKRASNIFGLKFKVGRCPSALPDPYYKIGSEQNADGSYVSSEMQWFQFSSIDDCVKGYFDFINVARYENLKYVTDVKTYCNRLQEDGYATSLTYGKSLYDNYIVKYGLTRYDEENKDNMAKIVIALSAGHWNGNPKGVPASMPFLADTREFTMNNNVCQLIKEKMKDYPDAYVALCYDTTGKDGNQATNGNAARIKRAESLGAKILLDIHHNGGGGSGTTVFHYKTAKNKDQAKRLHDLMVAHHGLKGNRANGGVTDGSGYEMVRDPGMDSFIVECAFMDNAGDVTYMATTNWYERVADGIVAFLVDEFHLAKNNNPALNSYKESVVVETPKAENKEDNSFKVRAENSVAIYDDKKLETGKGTFTIIETKNGMGKLKSGTGWICLSDVKKL